MGRPQVTSRSLATAWKACVSELMIGLSSAFQSYNLIPIPPAHGLSLLYSAKREEYGVYGTMPMGF